MLTVSVSVFLSRFRRIWSLFECVVLKESSQLLFYLEERLHVLCFTPIRSGVRVISFRKANLREMKRYDKEIADQ
jgi:hypothetical protein